MKVLEDSKTLMHIHVYCEFYIKACESLGTAKIGALLPLLESCTAGYRSCSRHCGASSRYAGVEIRRK